LATPVNTGRAFGRKTEFVGMQKLIEEQMVKFIDSTLWQLAVRAQVTQEVHHTAPAAAVDEEQGQKQEVHDAAPAAAVDEEQEQEQEVHDAARGTFAARIGIKVTLVKYLHDDILPQADGCVVFYCSVSGPPRRRLWKRP